jgi:hypothetical protein
VEIQGREFPPDNKAGRNASTPMCSLVNELEEPTLWTEGEGRWMGAERTEAAHVDSRGGRDSMFLKICRPVPETRLRGWREH